MPTQNQFTLLSRKKHTLNKHHYPLEQRTDTSATITQYRIVRLTSVLYCCVLVRYRISPNHLFFTILFSITLFLFFHSSCWILLLCTFFYFLRLSRHPSLGLPTFLASILFLICSDVASVYVPSRSIFFSICILQYLPHNTIHFTFSLCILSHRANSSPLKSLFFHSKLPYYFGNFTSDLHSVC